MKTNLKVLTSGLAIMIATATVTPSFSNSLSPLTQTSQSSLVKNSSKKSDKKAKREAHKTAKAQKRQAKQQAKQAKSQSAPAKSK
jgi:hypothetical protein